eukprot:CAMPEP_0170581698 /NCGR_PEP_ID=MMETSP0224-20130122/7181_1 /TAXON_ID=285029 /ORGANISM="Togula jolla, Strain CCCM 725" /LENGTH=31 /DNA_ID= /DNA_START= /DNA_END= /DNA_ORIENTATION=
MAGQGHSGKSWMRIRPESPGLLVQQFHDTTT